jgi:hypothetical protein
MRQSIERLPPSGWSGLAATVMAGRAPARMRQGFQGPAGGCRGPAWRRAAGECYNGVCPLPRHLRPTPPSAMAAPPGGASPCGSPARSASTPGGR